MPRILDEKRFRDALKALDDERKKQDAAIVAPTKDLIPTPEDPLRLRGPSWTETIQAVEVPKDKGRLTVFTRHPDGTVIAGALVEVFRKGTTIVEIFGTTAANGFFQADITPDDYRVEASYLGEKAQKEVNVPGGQKTTVVIEIRRAGGGGGGGGPPGERPRPESGPPPGGGGGGGEGGSAPPPPQGPAGAPGTGRRLRVGDRVLAYGSMPGRVLSVPDAPGGMVRVELDTGVQIVAGEAELELLEG